MFLDITERCLSFPVIAATSGNRLIAKLCLYCLHLEYINLYRKMSILDIKFGSRQYFGNQPNELCRNGTSIYCAGYKRNIPLYVCCRNSRTGAEFFVTILYTGIT